MNVEESFNEFCATRAIMEKNTLWQRIIDNNSLLMYGNKW